MLLTFKGSNFKSFGDSFEFNMVPERISEIPYSILKEKVGGKTARALSASVIYGPNAAGKTSIINAMSCFRGIVQKGTIQNSETDRSEDHVSADMSLIPFKFAKEEKPVVFDITFISEDLKIRYAIAFRVGKFLSEDAERVISNEELWVNDSCIFVRKEAGVAELHLQTIRKYLNAGVSMSEADEIRRMMSGNIVKDSLLLTTDFNSFCSKRLVQIITGWMSKKFMVINSANHTAFWPVQKEGSAVSDNYLNKVAQQAGIIGSEFAYVTGPDKKQRLFSMFDDKESKTAGIDAHLIESVGTIRLIEIMPAILIALEQGATLVMDEFDASLHPSIVKNIIGIFHNNEINTNHAQLIFNSQNPIYLNSKIFRRDEIKFVERNEETKSSELYALSDFRTNGGDVSVRKTTDYMKNYFVDRYGAILDIDFSDIIKEMMERRVQRDEWNE